MRRALRLRMVGAAALAAVACGTLVACQTNVGSAASVGGQRISESNVNDYIRPDGPATGDVNAPQETATKLPPKAQVLQILVQQRVYEHVLAAHGGVPSNATLSGLHDQAARVLLQTSQTGSTLDASLSKQLVTQGIDGGLAKKLMRSTELEFALIDRLHLSQFPGAPSTVDKALAAGRAAALQTKLAGVTADQIDQAAIAPILPAMRSALTQRLGASAYVDVASSVDGALSDAVTSKGADPTQLPDDLRSVLRNFEIGTLGYLQQSQFPNVMSTVRKADVTVSVSPRYGRWDAKNLTIDTAGGTPAYLKLLPIHQPSTAPAAAR